MSQSLNPHSSPARIPVSTASQSPNLIQKRVGDACKSQLTSGRALPSHAQPSATYHRLFAALLGCAHRPPLRRWLLCRCLHNTRGSTVVDRHWVYEVEVPASFDAPFPVSPNLLPPVRQDV